MKGSALCCSVAFAGGEMQWVMDLVLPSGSTVGNALAAAEATLRTQSPTKADAVAWRTAETGVFGEVRSRDAELEDGDRVEIYRPLTVDPKEARRTRALRPGAPSWRGQPRPGRQHR